MPKRLSTLVNIALNYGFIENFRQLRSAAQQRANIFRKRGKGMYAKGSRKHVACEMIGLLSCVQADLAPFMGKFALGLRHPSGTGRSRERH